MSSGGQEAMACSKFEQLRMSWEASSRLPLPSCSDCQTFLEAVKNHDYGFVELELKNWCLDVSSIKDFLAIIGFLQISLNGHCKTDTVMEDCMRLCIFKGIWHAFYSTVARFRSNPPVSSFGDLIAAATGVMEVVQTCLGIVMPGIYSSQTESSLCASVTEVWSHLANTVRLNSKLVNSLPWRDVQVCLTQKLVSTWSYSQSDEILHAFLTSQLRFLEHLHASRQVLKDWSAFQSCKDDFERNFGSCIASLDSERGVEKNLATSLDGFKRILEDFDRQAPAIGSKPKKGPRKEKTYGQLEMMNDIQSLRRVLHYLSLTRSFSAEPEDASSRLLHVLLIERVLQVAGESVKNTAGSPNLSAKKRTTLERAKVPLETLSALRNALSHFNYLSVARKQHVEKAINVPSVLHELANLADVFAKALHRIEFTLLLELAGEQARLHEKGSAEALFFASLGDCQSVAQIEEKVQGRSSDDSVRHLYLLIQQFRIQAKICKMESLFSSVQHDQHQTVMNAWQDVPVEKQEVAKSTLTEISETKNIKELLQDLTVPTENTNSASAARIGDFLDRFVDSLAHKYMSREFYANVSRELFLGAGFPVNSVDVEMLLETYGDAEFATEEHRRHAGLALRVLDVVLHLKLLCRDRTSNQYFNGEHCQETLDRLSDLVAVAHFQPVTERQADSVCESIGVEDPGANFVVLTVLQDMFESVADETDTSIYDVVEKVIGSCCSAAVMEQMQRTKEDAALKAARLKLTAHIKEVAVKKKGILKEEEFNACKAVVNAALTSAKIQSAADCGNGRTRESDMKLLKNMASPFDKLCRSVKETKSLEEGVRAFREYLNAIDMPLDEHCAAVSSFRSMQQDCLESFVVLRIKQLRGLLSKYGIPVVAEPTRDVYAAYKCNRYLRAGVEMLLLECLEILDNLYTLPDSQAASFTACGPISNSDLRKYLAHGDSLLESCDHDICSKILDSAVELVNAGESVMALRKLLEDSDVCSFIRCAAAAGKLHTVHVSTVTPLSHREVQTAVDRLQSNPKWQDVVERHFKTDAGSRNNTRHTESCTKLMAEDALNLMLRNHVSQFSLLLRANPLIGKHMFRRSWTLLHYAMALKQNAGTAIDILLGAEVDVNAADDGNLTPLHLAVLFKSVDGVSRLLSSDDIDVDARNADGVTALHVAAQQGSTDIVQLLLSRNSKPNVQTHTGWSALHLAVGYEHVSIVELLLRAGANPNIVGELKWTPLHLATYLNQVGIMKLLLDHAADAYANLADDPFHASRSVVHLAASNGSPEAMQLLLDKGVDVELKCPAYRYGNEREPLHFAAMYGMEDNVEFLLSRPGLDKDNVDNRGCKAVDYAMLCKHLSLVKLMLQHGCSPNPNAIIDVAAQGDLEMLQLLHERGADLNATVHGFLQFTPSLAATLGGRLDVLEFLLAAVKPDIDELMKAACMYGCRSVVQLLIVEGHFPDPGRIFRSGHRTPLHVAANYGRLALVRYLVEDLALSIDALDGADNTPCMLAARGQMWAVVKYCLKHGADVSGERGGQMARIAAHYQQWTLARALFDKGASLDMQWVGDALGENMAVLVTAACKGHLGTLEYLIEKKHVDVGALPLQSLMVLLATYAKQGALHYLTTKGLQLASVRDCNDAAGLHHAALAGNAEACAFFLDDANLPVDQCDVHGCSALHYAIRGLQPLLVQYLLSRNADPTVKSLDGKSPLMLALSVSSFDIVDCLARLDVLLPRDFPDKEGNSFLMLLVKSFGVALPLKKFAAWLDHVSTDVFHRNAADETVLHCAAQTSTSIDALLLALNKGRATAADSAFAGFLNGKDRNGNSPLMLVVKTAHDVTVPRATETLVKYRPDLNVQNLRGQTVLHLAIQRQNVEVLGALLEPLAWFLKRPEQTSACLADPRLMDSTGSTPLEAARLLENKRCVDWMLNYEYQYKLLVLKSEEERTKAKAAEAAYFASLTDELALFDKSLMKDVRFVRLCLEQVPGFASMRFWRRDLPFHMAAEGGDVEVLECLVSAGSDAGAVNGSGQTALHVAASYGHVDAVDYLVRTVGLECSTLDDEGRKPAHCAANSGKVKVLQYLFEEGLADVSDRDANNETCLQIATAAGRNGVIELLLDRYGAVADIAVLNEAIFNEQLSTVELLLDKGALAALMKAGLNGNKSPLYAAIRNDCWPIAKLLLERASLEQLGFLVGDSGPVLLTSAAAGCQLDIVRLLVEKAGLDPNAPKNKGNTPLMCACQLGDAEVVRYLLSKNASPNAYHHNTKMTALHVAAKRGRLEAAQILVEHQADVLAKDYALDTPAHTAIMFGRWDVAVFILSQAGRAAKQLFGSMSFPHQEELRRQATARGVSIDFSDG